MSTNQGSSTSNSSVQEYIVRVPKPDKKRYHVMKFNASLKVDFTTWTQARLERENNLKDFKSEEDMPKFGAGSEFGRDMREEARKKKYGIISKKYNPDDQPWLLRLGGKPGKRYRGVREGGIAENASYYVFTQASDGAFEAFPISEWYQFSPTQTYKTLNAEEAEEEFGRRDKVFNYFSIMLKKRLKNEEVDGEGEENLKKDKKSYKASKDFKISDMDDWINSSDEDDDDEDGEGKDSDKDDKKKGKNKQKPKVGQKKKKKKKKGSDDSDDEAWEDSDDGDDEGREVDYMTDESSSNDEEPEAKAKDELKGVEDEEALRKMEDSGSEEENPDEKKEQQEEPKEDAAAKEKAAKEKKNEKKEDSSSENTSETSESDDFDNESNFQSAMFMPGSKKSKKSKRDRNNEGKASTSMGNLDKQGSGGVKRPITDAEKDLGATKKLKFDNGSLSGSGISIDGISEDAVRRYLMRKPMTTTELLQKFKSKKTGLGRDQMVNTITQILKRLNPEKQMIKGKMYLSIKQSFA